MRSFVVLIKQNQNYIKMQRKKKIKKGSAKLQQLLLLMATIIPGACE